MNENNKELKITEKDILEVQVEHLLQEANLLIMRIMWCIDEKIHSDIDIAYDLENNYWLLNIHELKKVEDPISMVKNIVNKAIDNYFTKENLILEQK